MLQVSQAFQAALMRSAHLMRYNSRSTASLTFSKCAVLQRKCNQIVGALASTGEVKLLVPVQRHSRRCCHLNILQAAWFSCQPHSLVEGVAQQACDAALEEVCGRKQGDADQHAPHNEERLLIGLLLTPLMAPQPVEAALRVCAQGNTWHWTAQTTV